MPLAAELAALLGLLRQVGRRVVAGDRVLGEDHRERQHGEAGTRRRWSLPPKKPVLLTVWVNTDDTLAWWLGHEEQDQHDGGGAEHVPPHRDVVEDREQVAGEDVHQRGQHEDRPGRSGRPGSGCSRAAHDVLKVLERQVEERRAAVGDRGVDREQADQVQPAGVVAGLRRRRAWRPTSRCRPRSGRPTPARTCTGR